MLIPWYLRMCVLYPQTISRSEIPLTFYVMALGERSNAEIPQIFPHLTKNCNIRILPKDKKWLKSTLILRFIISPYKAFSKLQYLERLQRGRLLDSTVLRSKALLSLASSPRNLHLWVSNNQILIKIFLRRQCSLRIR